MDCLFLDFPILRTICNELRILFMEVGALLKNLDLDY